MSHCALHSNCMLNSIPRRIHKKPLWLEMIHSLWSRWINFRISIVNSFNTVQRWNERWENLCLIRFPEQLCRFRSRIRHLWLYCRWSWFAIGINGANASAVIPYEYSKFFHIHSVQFSDRIPVTDIERIFYGAIDRREAAREFTKEEEKLRFAFALAYAK